MRLRSPVLAEGHCLGQFWRLYRYVRMKSPFGINNPRVTAAQEHFWAVLGAALSFAGRCSNYPHLTTQSFIQSFPGHWGKSRTQGKLLIPQKPGFGSEVATNSIETNQQRRSLVESSSSLKWERKQPATGREEGLSGGPTSWDPNATTRQAVHSTRGASIPRGSCLDMQEGQGHQQPRHRLSPDKVSVWPGRGSGARCLHGAPRPLKEFDIFPLYKKSWEV